MNCIKLKISLFFAKRDRLKPDNNTPLHFLGRFPSGYHQGSRLAAAEELVKAGADLSAVNSEGKTPMENELIQRLREQMPELFQKKTDWEFV